MLALPNYRRANEGGHGGIVPVETPRAGSQDSDGDDPFDAGSISRSGVKMITRALEGRWPIAPETRLKLTRTLAHIIDNPDLFGARIVVNAAQALLNADKLNMEQEARESDTKQPIAIEVNGRKRLDFSHLTDEELERFVEGGGRE